MGGGFKNKKMKNRAITLTLVGVSLILISIFTGQSYAKIDPKSIVGIWLFDEGEGEEAFDSSDNGNNGRISGEPEWVEGKFGKALDLDGVDDCVDLGTDESLKPQRFTVVAWFSTRKLDGYGHIFQSGHDWNDMAGILLRVHQDGYFQGAMATGPGNTASWCNGPALSDDTWYHAALTFDGTTLTLYLDGKKADSTGGGEIFYDNVPVRIGSHPDSLTSLFDGLIDEIALFNVALAENDIKDIMNNGLEKASGISAVSTAGKLTTTWASIKAR